MATALTGTSETVSMSEILESNRRVGRVCDATTLGVAAVSIVESVSAPLLWIRTGSLWVAAVLPAATIMLAVVAAVLIQHGAVRRHEALCDAFNRQAGVRL